MLSHLLFSISAFIVLIVFAITYFSLNKINNNASRIAIYKSLIYVTLATTIIEILEGITYVYDYELIFNLLWKLHFACLSVFYFLLYKYLLEFFEIENYKTFNNMIWNDEKPIKNVILIIFLILIVYSLIFIKPYSTGLSSFLFYTEDSYLYLFSIFIIYIAFMIYIIVKKKKITRSEHFTMAGTFTLNILNIFMSYWYPEVSFYCVLFILMLVLFYYFKENADLVYIDELSLLKNQIDSSTNAKLDYLYETVHDLINPLNAINNINNSIRNNECRTMDTLNNKISDLNVVSNDIINIINNPINLINKYRIDEMIFRLSKVADGLLKNKNIRFVYNIDNNLPSILVGESTKIYRVLLNLIVNSIEYTDVGRISISVKGETKKDLVFLDIRVSDTGVGIDKKAYGYIFDKVQPYPHDGMSLYLVKKYIDSLNGKITFESYLGSGTVFNIKIVQKVLDSTPISKNTSILLNRVVANDCTNKKVMILDKDYKCTKSVSKIFEKYGFSIETCDNAKDFIRKIKIGEQYNLILLSENIIDINYMELINILNYLKKVINIPVTVAFTSNIVDPESTFYKNNGFDDYLPKPINIRKLDYIIKTKCN